MNSKHLELSRLSEFDFVIKHKRGTANGNADCLSRLPIENNCEIDTLESFMMVANAKDNKNTVIKNIDMRTEQQKDPILRSIYYKLKNKNDYQISNTYELYESIIYKKPTKSHEHLRLVIPVHLREIVLESYHNDQMTAHVGRDRTYDLISKRYYWPGMSEDIRNWIKACLECAKIKSLQ